MGVFHGILQQFILLIYVLSFVQHKAKARLMEEEMIYGSKPSTPAKKRFLTTPTKTPSSKLRKVSTDTYSVCHSTNQYGQRSISHPALCNLMIRNAQTKPLAYPKIGVVHVHPLKLCCIIFYTVFLFILKFSIQYKVYKNMYLEIN